MALAFDSPSLTPGTAAVTGSIFDVEEIKNISNGHSYLTCFRRCRIRASRFCSNTINQESRPSSQFEFSHPSIHSIPSIHTSIHPFIQPPIHPSIHSSSHPSIHPSTTILVTLAGPAQTSSEEMRARGRDEQEESVNAAASPAFSITISAPRNRLHVRVVGGVVLSRAAALMGTSQS